jgi:hypothetical protein
MFFAAVLPGVLGHHPPRFVRVDPPAAVRQRGPEKAFGLRRPRVVVECGGTLVKSPRVGVSRNPSRSQSRWWQNSWQSVERNVPIDVTRFWTAVRIQTRISFFSRW